MIRPTLIASAVLALAACSPQAPPETEAPPAATTSADAMKLACGEDDFIRGDATKESLVAKYGADNVTEEQVSWVDSEVTAIVVFPADPAKRAEVLDLDKSVKVVRVGGEGSQWIGPKGVKIGASAEDVEKANGGPFELMGFSNHNAGELTDTLGGKLEDEAVAGCSIDLTFDTPQDLPADAVEKVNNDPDKSYRSDSPEMRAARPRVYEFVASYLTGTK